MSFQCSVPTNQLVEHQKSDPKLSPLLQEAFCESEAAKVPICYYMKSGVLTRKWRPPTIATNEEWQVSHQIVAPTVQLSSKVTFAHVSDMSCMRSGCAPRLSKRGVALTYVLLQLYRGVLHLHGHV